MINKILEKSKLIINKIITYDSFPRYSKSTEQRTVIGYFNWKTLKFNRETLDINVLVKDSYGQYHSNGKPINKNVGKGLFNDYN